MKRFKSISFLRDKNHKVLNLRVNLPEQIIIEKKAIERIPVLLQELDNFNSIFLILGKKTKELIGKKIEENLKKEYEVRSSQIKACDELTLERIKKEIESNPPDLFLGIGGGKNIDAAKALAYFFKKDWISIPTIPSHDGITSNRAVVSRGKSKYPIIWKPPLSVIADLNLLVKAPLRYFSAGCGDVIAKKTAVLDWKLAKEEKGEEYDEFTSKLCMGCADLILENSENFKEDFEHSVELLMKCLIACGISMTLVNSSRPCSGSEHAFYHALDFLYPQNKALHGEKVALGTYIMSYLHGIDHEKIRSALIDYNLPVNSKQIKIPSEVLIKALVKASSIRKDKRYTILRNGLSRGEAERILRKLKVI